MKKYDVHVDASNLERVEEILRNVPGGFETAVRQSLIRARDHLWTMSSREAQKKYAISPSNLRAERNARMTYRYYPGQGVEASVDFMGNKISLLKFDGSTPKHRVDQAKTVIVRTSKTYPTTKNGMTPVHPSIAAKGHQYRGTAATKFNNAFVAKMSNGHEAIFEREKGKTRFDVNLPINQMMGDAFPQMVGNEEVREELRRDAVDTMEKRLNHEVDRILKGYGMR